jgi:hypothetical protein
MTKNQKRIMEILRDVKKLAKEYYGLTQKPLGATGEIAEYEAAHYLALKLADAREPGHDATDKQGRKIQIKGRCILPSSKKSQRLGRIKMAKNWDIALMVLLDENFNATEIHEAPRKRILKELKKPGSKARNERGALSISKFKAIGKLRFPLSRE